MSGGCDCPTCVLMMDARLGAREIDHAVNKRDRGATGVLVVMWRQGAGPALATNVDRQAAVEMLHKLVEHESAQTTDKTEPVH